MRWENLKIGTEQGSRLPGYRDPATVRTFDAPEALGTRFYEIEARSAINSVPKRSRMPFRYTINPYRGCSHACVYCAEPGTPVLLADGRHKPLGELNPGDSIYGTERRGRYRTYVETKVVDKWNTRKEAFRITLEDGTELIASGDHRFLTDRGWKFVTGSQQGASRRPHLTLGDKLTGVGKFATQPEHCADYRRGYLCGTLRGDGTWGSCSYPNRSRSGRFLIRAGVETAEFEFASARAESPARRRGKAIRSSRRDQVEAVCDLVQWPRRASDRWRRGFLAGVLDAEGSRSEGVLRIANRCPEIIDWTSSSLDHLMIPHDLEDRGLANGLKHIRVTGGLKTQLEVLHATDPAIVGKRSLAGTAIKADPALDVVEIEPIGPRDLCDITTGTGDFIANGVVSHNCFARPTHTYLDLNAREDFEREIVVKVNLPEVLRAELARPSWGGEHVALGTNTDPYQWVEGRYRLTRGRLGGDARLRQPVLGADQVAAAAARPRPVRGARRRAPSSSPTSRSRPSRSAPGGRPSRTRRTRARGSRRSPSWHRNGIPTGVLIAPLMPGINDDPRQVERLLGLLGEAGAESVGGIGLHLRGEVREIWFDWLRQYRPDLVERYEQLLRPRRLPAGRRGAAAVADGLAVRVEPAPRFRAAARDGRATAEVTARAAQPPAAQQTTAI